MWNRIQLWLDHLPISDPLERRQARLLQFVELLFIAASLGLLPLVLLAPLDGVGKAAISTLTIGVGLASAIALLILRRRHVQRSAILLTVAMALLISVMLYGNTLAYGAMAIFTLSIPITLGGMLAGRTGLLAALAVSVLGVGAAITLEILGAAGSGFALATTAGPAPSTPLIFAILAGLLAALIDQLRAQMSEALAVRRSRERELETLARQLELSIRERTADLEMAITTLQQRADRQAQLLAENQRQQDLIGELSVPVLPLGHQTVVMPLVGGLDTERLEMLQERALSAVSRYRARRLLLDITGVPIVDTHVAQGLIRILQAARLLGAEVLLVGMRPEVAQAVVGLGLELGTLRSYADLETALQALGILAPVAHIEHL